jgi:hypothetical protein
MHTVRPSDTHPRPAASAACGMRYPPRLHPGSKQYAGQPPTLCQGSPAGQHMSAHAEARRAWPLRCMRWLSPAPSGTGPAHRRRLLLGLSANKWALASTPMVLLHTQRKTATAVERLARLSVAATSRLRRARLPLRRHQYTHKDRERGSSILTQSHVTLALVGEPLESLLHNRVRPSQSFTLFAWKT